MISKGPFKNPVKPFGAPHVHGADEKLEQAQENIRRIAEWYNTLPGDPEKGLYTSANIILLSVSHALELAMQGKTWEPPK